MRILHVIGSMDPTSGGPCQGIRNLDAGSKQLNLPISREVVCFDDPDAAYLGTDSFPVHPLGKGRTSWQYNPKLIPWLKQNLHRFDVVVSNGLWLFHSYAVKTVIAALRKKNTLYPASVPKWYLMPHGMLDPYFQGASGRKAKAVRNWLYWQAIEQNTVRQADGLLFTCETELMLARDTFRSYRPQREINVGYGVQTPPVYSKAMETAFLAHCPEVADRPYWLFLSRIHPKKGVDLLVEAYLKLGQELAKTGQQLPRMVIAGPGMDSTFGRSIQQLAQHYPKLWSNIHFTGMLTGDAKWGAFHGCEAFILPSHQENFGIAVAEALACGKPVLISDQVNIWREIAQEKGGLVQPNTQSGTYSLLQEWFSLSKDAKFRMHEQAQNAFAKYFAVRPAAYRFKEGISGQLIN